MALIAYLMEFKANYGPHLIIVPNAVIVNWKVIMNHWHIFDSHVIVSILILCPDFLQSELLRWIPSVSCIFYVGGKEQRTKLYAQVWIGKPHYFQCSFKQCKEFTSNKHMNITRLYLGMQHTSTQHTFIKLMSLHGWILFYIQCFLCFLCSLLWCEH